MSTDPSAAIGRLDTAVEESSRSSGAPPRELADLAASIDRIESLIADGAAQGPDVAERISDIAFTLHEHEVETSLCNTLDAAVREINDVENALKGGRTERAQQAAELLRQLSRRVHEMIAQSQANQRLEPAAGANVVQTPTNARRPLLDEGDGEDATEDGSFKTDVPEDDEFALVVAALTVALPTLAEFGAPVPVPPAALAQDAAPSSGSTILPELSVETADEATAADGEAVSPQPQLSEETVVVIESSNAVLLDEPVLPQPPSNEGASGKDLAASDPLALGEDFVHDLMSSENPTAESSVDVVSSSDAPAEDSPPNALLALPAPEAPADSTHEAHREDGTPATPLPLVAPDDDPGDLFELTIPEPSFTPEPERAGLQAAEKVPEAEEPVQAVLSISVPLEPESQASLPVAPQHSRAATAAPAQSVPRLAPNDPLGPVRALTEEETIALFS